MKTTVTRLMGQLVGYKKKVGVVGVSRKIGGAARATDRMFQGLKRNRGEISYEFYCSEGSGAEGDSFRRLPWKGGLRIAEVIGGSELTRRVLDIRLRIWIRLIVRKDSEHQFFWSSGLVQARSIEKECSLVHYVWVQFIGESFNEPRKPYIVTLHDMWHLTGGCAYSYGCKEYESGCRMCPEVRVYARRGVRQRKKKKIEFLNSAYSIVVTSEWMRRQAISAGVNEKKIVKIENYVPENYTWSSRENLRCGGQEMSSKERLRNRLYFVGSVRDPRKGFDRLVDALKITTGIDWDCWELSILGCEDDELERVRKIGINARGYGILSDDNSQVGMYCEASILVCPSFEDNSPNVIAEAHCCGLPVIAIGMTGAAEMVEENVNGWVAVDQSAQEIGKTIVKAMSAYDKLNRDKIAEAARSRYGEKNTLNRYVSLYKSALMHND